MANVNNGITKANQTQVATAQAGQVGLKGLLMSMRGQIEKALPSILTPERFTRMVMTALSNSPQLQQCTPASFLGAMMQAAQLGVEPNTPLGQAYLIPYKNKGTLECQFQLGYKGLLDLAYRSGEITVIQAHAVHQNDVFDYEYGLEAKLVHKPAITNRGPVIAYYAMYKQKDGGYGFEVASLEDIQQHASKYSVAFKKGASTPWQTDFDAMAKKTVLKAALKYAPLKSEFVKAVNTDQTIKTTIAADMVDQANEAEPPTIEVEQAPAEEAEK